MEAAAGIEILVIVANAAEIATAAWSAVRGRGAGPSLRPAHRIVGSRTRLLGAACFTARRSTAFGLRLSGGTGGWTRSGSAMWRRTTVRLGMLLALRRTALVVMLTVLGERR